MGRSRNDSTQRQGYSKRLGTRQQNIEAQFSVAEAELKHGGDGNAVINEVVVKTRTFDGPTS